MAVVVARLCHIVSHIVPHCGAGGGQVVADKVTLAASDQLDAQNRGSLGQDGGDGDTGEDIMILVTSGGMLMSYSLSSNKSWPFEMISDRRSYCHMK